MARQLGARVIVAGMRPPVALTLVEFGIELVGVKTGVHAVKGLDAQGWPHRSQPPEGARHV
ncbi:STAS domain-containing protein, partial [Streptomyces chryseus]